MMQGTFLILSLFIVSSVSVAQSRYDAKSLQTAMANISVQDNDAIQHTSRLLNQVTHQDEPALIATTLAFAMKVALSHQRFARVERYYHSLASLATSHPQKSVQKPYAQALLTLAKARFDQARYRDALNLIDQQALPAIQAFAPMLLDKVHFRAARSALHLDELERAKSSFSAAEQTLIARGDERRLARLLTHKASYLIRFWDIDLALASLIEASEYQQALNDKGGLFFTYRAMGRLYMEIDDLVMALDYFDKAKALGHPRLQARASLFYNMAQVYQDMSQPEKALAYADSAIALMGRSSSDADVVSMLFGKMAIQLKQRSLDASWQTLEQIRQHTASLHTQSFSQQRDLRLAEYYFLREQIPEALRHIQATLAITGRHQPLQSEKYQLASAIFEQANMPQQALRYHKKLRDLEQKKAKIKDKQRSIQQQNQVNLLIEQKNTAVVKQQMLEKQHQLQQAQSTQQRWWFAISLCMLLLFGLVYLRLTRNKRQALHASRLAMDMMEQKNQFIAHVAHELKNPLTVIQIHLEALRDGMVKEPEQAHHVLEQRLSQLTHNIDELRQASLMSLGALTLSTRSVTLVPWLNREIDAFRPLLAAKELDLHCQFSVPETFTIEIDSDRLSQVLANLIKNSLRYTHKPGKITLSAHIDEDKLCVTLEDTPPVPPQGELSKLFDQGYRSGSTTEMSNQGSGLGLYICKEIILAHHGEITAEQSPHGGLRIRITLPINRKNNSPL